MKKRIIAAVMAAMLIPAAAHAGDISVMLNGSAIEFDVVPQIMNNRTMVPLRAIFEALGAEVGWDGATRTVTSNKNGAEISLAIGSDVMYVNGSAVTLDQCAVIVDGRTLVPVRAISEAYGVKVDWDGDTQTVYLTSQTVSDSFRRLTAAIKANGKYDAEYKEYVIDSEVGVVYASVVYEPDTDSLFFYYSEREQGNSYKTVSLLLKNDGRGAAGVNVSDTEEEQIIYISDGVLPDTDQLDKAYKAFDLLIADTGISIQQLF